MHREDLAHEQPGDGAEAQREGDDVAAQAAQRQPRGLLPVAVEEAHAARAHAQPAERDQQQRPPACAVHEYHRHGRHQHLQRRLCADRLHHTALETTARQTREMRN